MKNRDVRARSYAFDTDSHLDQAQSFAGFATAQRNASTSSATMTGSATMDAKIARSNIGWEHAAGAGTRTAQNPQAGIGAGVTQLIDQSYNPTTKVYDFSGRRDTDAILIGSRYTITNITFSFPASGALYADQGYPDGAEPATQVQFNAMQQTAVRYALNLVSTYANLTFTEITETADTHAHLRLSQTNDSDVGSAYGNFPSSSLQAGDVWFNAGAVNPQPFYQAPAVGNWGQATIMHELGHTLGLKHGHQDYTNEDLTGNLDPNPDGSPRPGSTSLTRDHDGQDWSLMTYASDPSIDSDYPGFEGEGFNQPQTYMQDDIAALQYLYGANYNTQSGDTVYRWNPNTGVESINGVAQAVPSSNKISMTVWDGNGTDTYDLSAYTTDMKVDLRAGAFSTFSTDQLVNHQAYSGGTALAAGNVANALLYQGNTQSLIENADGGSGADTIIGNEVANVLTGNGGADTLIGGEGDDTLKGGAGRDTLYGDSLAGSPSGISYATGTLTKAKSFDNSSAATAINLSARFRLGGDPDIADATTVPHVSITATGNDHVDYYKLTVQAGAKITLDIDHTNGLDGLVRVVDSAGNFVAYDDDSQPTDGAGGSVLAPDYYLSSDPFLIFTAKTSGTYYIEVGSYSSTAAVGAVAADATYELQVSVADIAAVGGGAGNDTLDGGAGADTMVGGGGNDTYVVDNAGDKVIEKIGEGTDRVTASVSYKLAGGEEIERLQTTRVSGTTAIDLTGNEFDNIIQGNAGDNILDGKAGSDTLYGFGGDDLYIVESATDRVVEARGGGTDRVLASVSYTLAAGQEIEKLTTQSSLSTTSINLTGNAFDQIIQGNAGNNILNGGGGADMLYGRGGNDTYIVDNAGDRVFEDVNDGNDRVLASVSYALDDGQSIERLTTTSSKGTTAIDLTGNELGQIIQGNAGANTIDGGLGADTLYGFGGADIFAFTTRLGGGNIDRIADFDPSSDEISLSRSVFTHLEAGGTLAASAFKDITGGAAVDADDRILYNHTTGALFYDADGSGPSGAIQFATIGNKATLTSADFVIAG